MKLDYNQYVDQLPATGYTSDGKLLWQPRWTDIANKKIGLSGMFGSYQFLYSGYDGFVKSHSGKVDASVDNSIISAVFLEGSYSNFIFSSSYSYFLSPIAGHYELLSSTIVAHSHETASNSNFYNHDTYLWEPRDCGDYGVGGYVPTSARFSDAAGNISSSIRAGVYRQSVSIFTPVYRITPIDTTATNNYYTINNRVDNLTGIYVDNSNNYYTDVTIVDETNNRYYDMTTKTYYDIKSWSYDYSSRTYFLTLDNDVALTVQFGDDCMTITNNNVTNSYQYVIKNNGTPDTPTTCKHDWQETIDTAPTCLEGGHASYTCSKCGETYEQILAAKGHDWKVIEHVNMVYNSDGTVATQGHTLYQCSVCGEQWYTDTGAPPPDVSGSSNILAWLQEFKIWLGDKLDNLFSGSGSNNFWTSTKDTVADVLSSLLEALLGFITDILGAILDLVKELLSFFFDLLSSVVISGISGFFSGLKDSRLFDFAQKGEDGSVTALPDGVAAVFAFFSGVLLALPVELRSLLFFGTALVVLIGVINIIRS